jgi:hypothetical protein
MLGAMSDSKAVFRFLFLLRFIAAQEFQSISTEKVTGTSQNKRFSAFSCH